MIQTPQKSQIVIVDDHPVFCLGMSELISREPDLTVVACPNTAEKARHIIEQDMPDLIIVDISLAESNGIDLVAELRCKCPDLPILVLSMYDDSMYAERALMAGARGYVMKRRAIVQVVDAVRQVLSGHIYASDKIKEKLLNRIISRKPSAMGFSMEILTNREIEVFRLMGEGLDSKEIAARLNLSMKTVGTHRENIKEKLHLKHYTELVKAAVHWVYEMKK
ncbi:response regulator transcription factor [Desulfobacter postgatei]|jgi:DNA-binding NarL/FixJ family response regulator|uniref:response regulator transcription factor n=1 Tax=Desulfobacter postgatei TaxID=2293 RepID=UPI002A361DBD|nr:response regulator transcription factor [Desulfobacter postgatei]MDX9963396.1 response regulator transcription factor [Desulfobacter postgatei]